MFKILQKVTYEYESFSQIKFFYSLFAVIAVGDTLKGTWLQIQCGNYVLPEEKDKEAATNGVFFVDPVSQQFISDIISLVCGHGLFNCVPSLVCLRTLITRESVSNTSKKKPQQSDIVKQIADLALFVSNNTV